MIPERPAHGPEAAKAARLKRIDVEIEALMYAFDKVTALLEARGAWRPDAEIDPTDKRTLVDPSEILRSARSILWTSGRRPKKEGE